jgi:hypothetical protein
MRISLLIAAVVSTTVVVGACSEKKAIYLQCNETAKKLLGEPGTEYAIECPQQCGRGTVYGSDLYTDDSAVCAAAVHAGKIDSTGGKVTLTIEKGAESYKGSARNGVNTKDWNEPWNRSFTLD